MKSLRRILVFLKPYKGAAILAPVFIFAEVIFDLLQPTIMQRIIDIGIKNLDLSYVIRYGALMIAAAALGGVGAFFSIVFSTKAGVGLGTDLRESLFRKVQGLSFKNLDKLETGHIITRLTNDVKQVQNSVMMSLALLVRAPFLFIGSILMASIVCPQFIWIIVVIVVFLLCLMTYFFKKIRPLFKLVQERIDDLNAIAQENLAGIRVVKAFVRRGYEVEKFEKANISMMDTSMRTARMIARMFPMMGLIINSGVVLTLWFGGRYVDTGTMQIGQVMAFINYLFQLSFAMLMVAFVFAGLTRAEASAERILEILDEDPDIANSEQPVMEPEMNGTVAFNNVSFAYFCDAQEMVLKNINFTVLQGQTVAILGQTGAGKTSFIDLIPRFYDVLEGSITVGGMDIRKIDKKALRKKIGIALQKTVLFEGTIKENICFAMDAFDEAAMIEASKAACAHGFIMKLPNGYDTKVSQKGVNLSGGQKQRIAIARALASNPDILILDDSTSSVDVTTEGKIQDALKSIMKDKTSFVIAQRVSTVLDADKIIILDNGEIVAEGTHETLMASSPIYQDIYDSQLGGREGF